MEVKISKAEWGISIYEELALMDEKRLRAAFNMQLYQRKISQAFNKKVKIIKIREVDLVLKQARSVPFDPRGKFKTNWEGLYIVKKILQKDGVRLSDLKGNEFIEPVNLDRLKKYYV